MSQQKKQNQQGGRKRSGTKKGRKGRKARRGTRRQQKQ
jgi:hypothetical protein